VATVTASAPPPPARRGRYPDAVAEGMEGFGVAAAADRAGVGFAELRAISNVVGPRDRSAWRIPQALAALTSAAGALARLGQ
jgi:futalosine hydrolase